MKLYKRMVRPMLMYPGPKYEPKYKQLEQDGKWYPEADISILKARYQYLEDTFNYVVFDEKYEEVELHTEG